MDGTPYTVVTEQGRVDLRITDERGKIDINRAPEELLRGLLLTAGLDADQAFALSDAIIDFRDPDTSKRAQGAEDADYASARVQWDARDAPFQAREDLMQVLGMTPEIYARIAPAVTVYSRQAAVNPTNASRQVLLALPGVEEAEADEFIAARTQDGAATRRLLGTGEFQTRLVLPVFTVSVDVTLSSRARFRRDAVVSLDAAESPPYSILAWMSGSAE